MVEITQINEEPFFTEFFKFIMNPMIAMLPSLVLIIGIVFFIMIFITITKWVWNLGAVENK